MSAASVDDRIRRRGVALAIGSGGAALALVPWLVGGGTLMLQNLWATQAMPADMPFVLLPVSQYYVFSLFALLLMGGVFAGLATRIGRVRHPNAVGFVALGVGVVHAIAIVQTFVVVAVGHGIGSVSGDRRAVLYVSVMLGVALVSAGVAQLALWMISRESVTVASLGIALAAVPFASWVGVWMWVFAPFGAPEPIRSVMPWLPAVIVGLALVWCGARPLVRLWVWVAALAALWLVPSLTTAAQYGLGMRVLRGDVAEMVRMAAGLFPVVLLEMWRPVVVALVIAVLGVVVRGVVGRVADSRQKS